MKTTVDQVRCNRACSSFRSCRLWSGCERGGPSFEVFRSDFWNELFDCPVLKSFCRQGFVAIIRPQQGPEELPSFFISNAEISESGDLYTVGIMGHCSLPDYAGRDLVACL